MAISSKGCKPHNFESCNSLELSFTNIQDLPLNFVECRSFLESNPPDILALCQTTLDDSNDSICDAAIVHRNLFFFLICSSRINLLNLKNFRQASNRYKRFLKLPNFHMLIKQKSLSLPRNVTLRTFGKLLIVFSTKVNLKYLLCSRVWRCCLLPLIKHNCLLNTFLRTVILKTKVSLC